MGRGRHNWGLEGMEIQMEAEKGLRMIEARMRMGWKCRAGLGGRYTEGDQGWKDTGDEPRE